MTKIYKFNKAILTLIVLGLFSSTVFSQDNTMFWMKHLPQSMNTNPAKQSCKLFITLPVLPNFSFNANHKGFSFNDAIMNHPTAPDSFMIDLNTIEKALKEKNAIFLETNFSIFNLGLALRNNLYLTFGINYKISEQFQYPKALLEVSHGNYRENGTPLAFNFTQNFTVYRETYLGLSKKLYNGFTLGARIKYLTGHANLSTKSMKFDWYTSTKEEDTYDWIFESDFDIRTSTPVDWNFKRDSANKINGVSYDTTYVDNIGKNYKDLIFTKNHGLALDVGAEYNINDRFLFSASVIDLGFISWKANPKIMTQKGSFRYNGYDLTKYINSLSDAKNNNSSLQDSVVNDILDTLLTFYDPTIKNSKYTTGLNTKIYLGANISVKEWLDFGLLYRGAIVNKKLYSSYTASANLNFFKAWSYSASYSIMDGFQHNIGMGIAYKVGPFQMYLVTDNIAVPFWAINQSSFSDKWIRNTKRANLSFGINFMLCGKNRDRGLLE